MDRQLSQKMFIGALRKLCQMYEMDSNEAVTVGVSFLETPNVLLTWDGKDFQMEQLKEIEGD